MEQQSPTPERPDDVRAPNDAVQAHPGADAPRPPDAADPAAPPGPRGARAAVDADGLAATEQPLPRRLRRRRRPALLQLRLRRRLPRPPRRRRPRPRHLRPRTRTFPRRQVVQRPRADVQPRLRPRPARLQLQVRRNDLQDRHSPPGRLRADGRRGVRGRRGRELPALLQEQDRPAADAHHLGRRRHERPARLRLFHRRLPVPRRADAAGHRLARGRRLARLEGRRPHRRPVHRDRQDQETHF